MAQTYTSTELLAHLIGFDTTSHRSNLDLIAFVEGYLAGHGIASTRVPDETGEKASLYAHVGPLIEGGVILSGHTDVVPVDGQPWSTDPFSLTHKDGKLYGRGTCDMKGFLACALAALPQMLSAGLARPIQFALTYDEEVGCIAAPPLIDAMEALPKASVAIIGEPSMMQVVTGHKAIIEMNTTVLGHEVHSSLMHQGVSAVMVAAKLIAWLEAQNAVRDLPEILDDSAYIPPWTTLHVGKISGGTAHNITARECRFTTDIRAIPEEGLDMWVEKYEAFAAELDAEVKAVHPEAGVIVERGSSVPGCRAEENGIAETMVRRLTGDNGTHVVSYATEAGQFQDGGYSAVICGPGSIEQAHQPDEYISVDQIAKGDAFITKLIGELSH